MARPPREKAPEEKTKKTNKKVQRQAEPPEPATKPQLTEQQQSPLERILAQSSSVSQLEQLCSAFGWGRCISYQKGPGWVAEVTCGLDDVVRVESNHHHPRTKKGEKAGRAAAASQAVRALSDRARAEFEKAPLPLDRAFQEDQGRFAAEVAASSKAAWSRLLAALEGASERAVGVGTAGNDGSGLPTLVQIASEDLVLVELPRARGGEGELSKGLARLLADPGVTKVFCDSAAHRDMRSLGLTQDSPGVVNLEQVAVEHFGRTSASRGLAKIAGLVRGARVEKGDAGCLQEFEKTRASNISEYSEEALRYAALEAHAALRAWRELRAAAAKAEAEGRPVGGGRAAKVVVAAADKDATMDSGDSVSEEDADLREIDDDALGDEIAALERQLRKLAKKEGGAAKAAAKAAAKPAKGAKGAEPAKREEAKDGPARAAEPKARKWAGWKRALDEELAAAGGAAPWRSLRDALVAKRRRCYGAGAGGGGEEQRSNNGRPSDEELGIRALASIPDAYLSKQDGMVRRPKA